MFGVRPLSDLMGFQVRSTHVHKVRKSKGRTERKPRFKFSGPSQKRNVDIFRYTFIYIYIFSYMLYYNIFSLDRTIVLPFRARKRETWSTTYTPHIIYDGGLYTEIPHLLGEHNSTFSHFRIDDSFSGVILLHVHQLQANHHRSKISSTMESMRQQCHWPHYPKRTAHFIQLLCL